MSMMKGMNPLQVLFDPLKLFIKDKEKKPSNNTPTPASPTVFDPAAEARVRAAYMSQRSAGVTASGTKLGNVG